jgi:Carboxypeptidase regulatory-like domain/TonB dependent receptor/TonB-dependent Receptor Plug Domain
MGVCPTLRTIAGGESLSFQRISAFYLFARAFVIFLILVIVLSVPIDAQVAGGTLSGTITDPSEKLVPQAQVSITNVATGITTTVTTNSDGFYIAPNLLPGEYQVTVSAKGFSTETKKGILLSVGSQQVFNLTLQVGSAARTVVEVTTEAPAVQLASSDISAVVNATTVRELPLNGRSWTDLAALQPGVDTIHAQPDFSSGPDRGNRGFGQQLTISGARPQQNNYRLDGVSLNDYANGAPGSVLGGNLGVDAIQEFSVLTSNYSAEYGKTSGGVINAVTRSGTNGFHGSVYEFLRNSALDAKNFFEQDPTLPKASFRQNQFGGAIGGPLIKNRTFFFADYEGIRRAKGIPNFLTVPSPDVRVDPTVDPAIRNLFALYPMPTASPTCGGAANPTCKVLYIANQVIREDYLTSRVDHKFSEKDSVFGTYLYDKTPYHSPDSFGNVGLFSLTSRQILAVEETHSFTPVFVNAARFGFNHQNTNNNKSVADLSLGKKASDVTLGAFQSSQGFQDRAAPAIIGSTGLTPFSGGVGGSPTYYYGWNSFQGYDDAFLVRGTHSIKFGAAVERMQMEADALTDVNGIWIFGSFSKLLANQPTHFNGGVASTLKPRNFRQTIFGAYLQDDWRWKPNLTLNLGLRYEMATVMTETNGRLVNLPSLTAALPICGTSDPLCGSVGPLFANPTLHNFEPRIGFSWDPLKTGRMAVRGGAGLFDVLPLPYQFILLETQSVPFFDYLSLSTNTDGSALKVGPLPQMDGGGTRLRTTFIDPHPKRNYVMQWNLNLQYSLTPNLAAMVAYVGSRGVHQPYRVDEANLVIPSKLPSGGYIWPKVDVFGNVYTPGQCTATDPNGPADPASCAPPPLVNSHFSSIRGMFYQGRSYYNALETQLAKRMSHGFQAQGTFTWAKSIDTSSATLAGDAFGNSISSLNYFDPKLTRGLSDFNVGRTLVLNANWEVPGAKSWSGPAKWVTDGWELGLIFTASDGVPFTATWGTGADPAGTLSQDDFAFPNLVGGPGCKSLTNPGNPSNYIKTQCFTIPLAPDSTFWAANCNNAPPNLGGKIPDPINFPWVPALACFNLRGNAGRNILIGPGVTSLDFSVFKNNRIKRISETFNVQFRAEIFNILNHPNFGVPSTTGDANTDIFDGTGLPQSPAKGGIAGALVRTTVNERQIQFALKIIF